jgi:hypothetical protein
VTEGFTAQGIIEASDRILAWAARWAATAPGDLAAISTITEEIDVWLGQDMRHCWNLACAAPAVASSLMSEYVRAYGLSKATVGAALLMTSGDGTPLEPAHIAAGQLIATYLRADREMVIDMIIAHGSGGGPQALVDIGTTCMEIIVGLMRNMTNV